MLQNSLLHPRPAWTIQALQQLGRHRFLTARQLAAVLDLGEADVAATCTDLVTEGVLQTLCPTTLSLASSLAPAFALTQAGLACLAGEGGEQARRVTRPLTSSFTLAHELLVNELALVLERLDAMKVIRLLSWQTVRERLADVTHLAVKGRAVRVPLVADALAIIEYKGRQTGLLVEVDMGTVSTTTMRRKFMGYHLWWAEGGPVRRFGLASTRVLTIAPALRRLQRLRDVAIEAVEGKGSGLFWFLPHAAVDVTAPERMLSAVARIGKAGEDELRSLIDP